MDHADYLIDLLDADGNIIGTKPRRHIDKTRDRYHSVFVIAVQPDGKLLLSPIPQNTSLPYLYAGRLGMTVATIKRRGETAEQAAWRAILRDVDIADPQLTKLEQNTRWTLYKIDVTPIQPEQALTIAELGEALAARPDAFSPIMHTLWQKHRTAFGADWL